MRVSGQSSRFKARDWVMLPKWYGSGSQIILHKLRSKYMGKQMVWLAIPWLLLTLKRFVTGNNEKRTHPVT